MAALRARPAGRPDLSAEEGFALPLAASILVLAGLLVLATLGFATHNTDRANRDRDAIRAAQAADAGIDVALYRLNKGLTASEVQGLLGLPVSAVAEIACIEVKLGVLVTLELSGDWCVADGTSEQLDSGLPGGPGWEPAGFSYSVSSGTNLGANPNDSSADLIERRIVATGSVGGVSKRVLATARAQVGTAGNLVSLFEQIGYKTCSPEPTNPSDPASGC